MMVRAAGDRAGWAGRCGGHAPPGAVGCPLRWDGVRDGVGESSV